MYSDIHLTPKNRLHMENRSLVCSTRTKCMYSVDSRGAIPMVSLRDNGRQSDFSVNSLAARTKKSTYVRSLTCSTFHFRIHRHCESAAIVAHGLSFQRFLVNCPIVPSVPHTALLFLSRIFNVASSILFRLHEQSSKKSQVRHLYASSTQTPSAALSPFHHLISLSR